MPPSLSLSSRPVAGRFRTRASLDAAAALAVLATPSLLQAQIVWSGTLNTTVSSGSNQALLDLDKDSAADSTEAYLRLSENKGDYNLLVEGITSSKTDSSIAFLYVDTPVAFGATINSSLDYLGEHIADLVPADDASYYYAFSYQAAGGPYYGWMQLSHSSDDLTGTLHQWAYNSTAGASLTAGQTSAIPEPATVGVLLGVTALGAAAWWRRRQAALCA